MNTNKFNQFASSLGYHKNEANHTKNVYTSTHNGFPVALTLGTVELGNVANGVPVLTIYLPNTDTTQKVTNEYSPKNIGKLLTTALKSEKVKVHPRKQHLHLLLRVNNKEDSNIYINRIYDIVDEVFNEQGIHADFACSVCGQHNCDSMYFDDKNELTPTHHECKSKLIEQTTTHYKNKQENSNFVHGLIGLLVGGFIGGIPSILSILLFEYELLYLYALIPIASLYGYKLLGGEPGIVSTLFIIVWSFIQVIVVIVLSYYFIFEQYFTIFETFEIITYDIGTLIEQSWFGFLSVFIGLIPTVIEGLNTANKKSKTFLKSVENMQSYTPTTNLDIIDDSQENTFEEEVYSASPEIQ